MASDQFAEDLKLAAMQSLIKAFRDGQFILPDYANRYKIPPNLVERVYAQVDMEAVLAELKPVVQSRVASAIIGNLETEIKTDVKRLLTHEGTRLRLRMVLLKEIEKIGEELGVTQQ